MRTASLISLAAALLVATSPARADEDSGLTLGLRAMYGLPFGSAAKGTDLNKLTLGIKGTFNL